MARLQRIVTHFWFNDQAEEAVKFYTSIFKSSSTGRISHYGKAGYEQHHHAAGSVLAIEFTIEGQNFVALNGGPDFKFNESTSFIIYCGTQDEIDYYWGKLTKGGDEKAQVCGWLKDKYGVSWQVVPTIMPELMNGPVTEKTERLMTAMFQMKKLNIATLKQAYDGKQTMSI